MFSMTRSKIVMFALLSFVWTNFAHATPGPTATNGFSASSKGGHSKSKAGSKTAGAESASEGSNSPEVKKPAVNKHSKKSK